MYVCVCLFVFRLRVGFSVPSCFGIVEEPRKQTRFRQVLDGVASNELAVALCGAARVPDFLKHSESMTAPLDAPKFTQHAELWRKVYAISETMTLTQRFMDNIFRRVAVQKWGYDMAARIKRRRT